jgi:hypothetical protein
LVPHEEVDHLLAHASARQERRIELASGVRGELAGPVVLERDASGLAVLLERGLVGDDGEYSILGAVWDSRAMLEQPRGKPRGDRLLTSFLALVD